MTTVSHLHTWYKHKLLARFWTPIYLHNHMDRFLTKWAFHRVQEHPKQSLDKEVIVVRNWRQTKQKLTLVFPRHSMLCHAVAWQQLACCTLWRAAACRSMPEASLCPGLCYFSPKFVLKVSHSPGNQPVPIWNTKLAINMEQNPPQTHFQGIR